MKAIQRAMARTTIRGGSSRGRASDPLLRTLFGLALFSVVAAGAQPARAASMCGNVTEDHGTWWYEECTVQRVRDGAECTVVYDCNFLTCTTVRSSCAEDLGELLVLDSARSVAWTAVGSAGTVDDGDLDDVSLSLNYVRQKPASETVRDFSYVRYNVTAVGDLADPEVDFYDVTVKGFDSDGDGTLNDGRNRAHVVVSVWESNLRNGARSREIFNFNTKDDLRDPGLFEQTIECVQLPFDWSGRSQYYVQVILQATTDSAIAEFQGISIRRTQSQSCR